MPDRTPWYAGAPVPLAYSNTDAEGNPADAGTIVVTVTAPDGSTDTPSVTRSGTGAYSAVYVSSQAGHHLVSWVASGTGVPGAYTDTFEVQAASDPTIVSLAEAKDILGLDATAQFDPKLQGYNAAVTQWIEYVCGPVVQQVIVERLPSRGVMQPLSKPPVIELVAWTGTPPGLPSSVPLPVPPSPMYPTMLFGIPYPLDQLYADPKTGIVTHTSGLPFIYGSYLWQYKAGRPVIPACIYEASKIVLKHLYMVELGGAGAGTGGTGTGGGEEETTATPFGFAVPSRAIEILLPESAATRMVVA